MSDAYKSMNNKRNLMVKLSYDGSRYHGWQIQKNALSVQEVFQNSLTNVLGEAVDIKGCSRTDSGVHANMYCVSFKTSSSIKAGSIVYALNRYLPKDIAAISAVEVNENFHARYSCKGKEYIYKIWNDKIRNPFLHSYALHYWYPLDCDVLHDASRNFIGTHDFTSFATIDKRETKGMVRTIYNFEVHRENQMVEIKVSANGFLYNMVRIMVGTILRIAQGKISPTEIPEILEKKDRSLAGPTAPPQGLYLNRVFYG